MINRTSLLIFILLSVLLTSSVVVTAQGSECLGTGNALCVDADGQVGLGVTNASTKLHINGTGIDNNGTTAVVRIVSGNGAQNLLLDGNEIDATADGLFLNNNTSQNISLANGGGRVGVGLSQPSTKLHVNGTTRTNILEITGGSDLAEPFVISNAKSIEPGLVVAIDPENMGQLRIADHAYDPLVVGVVSGAGGLEPGIVLQQSDAVSISGHPVALVGRVYVWSDASSGRIQPGDLLTTSDVPGHAMKVADPSQAQGAILGKAMSSLESGRGLVLLLVSLQ